MTLPKQLTPKTLMCALLGAGAVYLFVNEALVTPWSTVNRELESARTNYTNMKKEVVRLERLHARRTDIEARTFPERTAQNNVDALMKRLLNAARLDQLIIKPASPTRLPRTQVNKMTCNITAEGTLADITKFLLSLYTEPFLNRINRLRVAPLDRSGGGADMKLELQIETLVFPDAVATIPASQPTQRMKGLTPLRPPAFAADIYSRIAERNIFAAFEAPPTGLVRVTNDDRLAIDVTIESFWHGKKLDTQTLHLESKASKDTPPMKGHRFSATAKYSDGKTYAAAKPYEIRQRFDTTQHRFDFRVPSHTPPPPPPPPTEIQLLVASADDKAVDLSIEMDYEGQPLRLEAIKVNPRTPLKLPKRKTARMTLTAKYDGGGTFGPKVFLPDKNEQRWDIPAKPINATGDEPVVNLDIPDPPADTTHMVSGLWTYPDGGELIGTDTAKKKRKIFELGDTLDGGKLIFIHSLGGIVLMPNGHYFLYPLGKNFTDRALLTAKSDRDLPQALAAWSSE